MYFDPMSGDVHSVYNSWRNRTASMRKDLLTWPARAIFGIDELAAEALLELLGVRALRKAEDDHVGVVAAE